MVKKKTHKRWRGFVSIYERRYWDKWITPDEYEVQSEIVCCGKLQKKARKRK